MEKITANSYDPEVSGAVSLTDHAARSSFLLLLAKSIRYGFVFIVQIILMNLLTPSDFGLLRFVTIVVGVINLVNEMGLSFAVVQKRTLSDTELSTAISVNALVAAALYAVVFALAPSCASWMGNTRLTLLLRAGGFASFIGSLSVTHRALLQRRFCYGRLAIIEISSAVTGSVSAVILALMGCGVWALLSSFFLFNTLSSILLLTTTRWPAGNYWNLYAAKSLFLFGTTVVIQRVIDYGAQNFDGLIIGKAFGEGALGVYSIAVSVINLPQLAWGVILGVVLLSAFSRIQNDNERLSQAFLRITVLTSVVSVPYFVLVFSFSKELMHAVSFIHYGEKWAPAAGPLHILAGLGLVYSLVSFPGTIWLSKGKAKLRMAWALIMLLSVIAAVAAGKPYGISGICYALVIRGIIFFPVLLVITQRVIGLSPAGYLRNLAPACLCGAIMLAVTVSISAFAAGQSLKRDVTVLVVGSVAGLLVYASLLTVFFKNTWKSFALVIESLKNGFLARKPQSFSE